MTGCSSSFHVPGMSDSQIEPPGSSRPSFAGSAQQFDETGGSDVSSGLATEASPSHDSAASYAPFNQAPPPPTNINVFGEFDGVERRDVRAIGESGLEQHTFVTEGYDGDVAVDPASRWIVFSSTRHNVHPQIYMQRVDGTSVIQLTNDSADNAYPTFSPDGKQIAFCSTRAGNWDIYVMDPTGRNVTQVTSGPSQDMHPSFSPDGTRIAYCSIGGRTDQWELWAVNIQTNEKRMIGYGLFPSWSPDRLTDRIAFQRARQRGSRWFSLWTMDLIDNEPRNITEVAVSANAALVSPSWSPDGKKITFATIVEPARTNNKGRPEGQQDIWTVNADGSNRHRITDGNATNAVPCWGADGRIYFISDRGGSECVWSGQCDGSPTKMAERKADNSKPAVGATDTRETH
jgi:Tol biopolymer transport system component